MSLPLFAAEVVIESRLDQGPWLKLPAVAMLSGQDLTLRVQPRPQAQIRWWRIVPDLATRYHNAGWPWESDAYKWLGYDEIKYARLPLPGLDDHWQVDFAQTLIPPGFSLNLNNPFYHADRGSFWLQAEISENGQVSRSPGLESRDQRGLSPQVFRVTVKHGDGLLGELSGYFNVPGVFGSTPYQVANYLGVDCADVLMAAFARSRGRVPKHDYNVARLVEECRRLAEFKLDRRGRPDRCLRWHQDFKAGDFIAVRYPGGRQYQHIGALYADDNHNGVLDGADLILHVGPDPLHFIELGSGAFAGEAVLLRPQ